MPYFKPIQKRKVPPLSDEFGNPAERDMIPWREEVTIRKNGSDWEELVSAGWNLLSNQYYYEPNFRVRGFFVMDSDLDPQSKTGLNEAHVLHYDLPWPNPEGVDGTAHAFGHVGWFSANILHPAYITRVRLNNSLSTHSYTNAPMIKLVG